MQFASHRNRSCHRFPNHFSTGDTELKISRVYTPIAYSEPEALPLFCMRLDMKLGRIYCKTANFEGIEILRVDHGNLDL